MYAFVSTIPYINIIFAIFVTIFFNLNNKEFTSFIFLWILCEILVNESNKCLKEVKVRSIFIVVWHQRYHFALEGGNDHYSVVKTKCGSYRWFRDINWWLRLIIQSIFSRAVIIDWFSDVSNKETGNYWTSVLYFKQSQYTHKIRQKIPYEDARPSTSGRLEGK